MFFCAVLVRGGVDVVVRIVLHASSQLVRFRRLLGGALVVTVRRLVQEVCLTAIGIHGHGVQANVHLVSLLILARSVGTVGTRNEIGLHEEVVLRGNHAADSDQHEGK